MFATQFILLTLTYVLHASAQENLTVAFFPSVEGRTCSQSPINEAISLTTYSIPNGYVCFNLSDIFTRTSDSGSQGLWRGPTDSVDQLVNYTLHNREDYNPTTNYTNVWYEQVNQTGEIKPGESGRWVFYTYAFEDCEQVGGDAFMPEKNYPWFETSCQTKDGGQCQELKQPVKSFAIGPSAGYDANHGGCEEWAKMGDASSLKGRTSLLAVVAIAMAILLV
ncbi:hypothetical protein ONS95_000250 [Cadophora gregata]|uniref:uncharacterized protein n=1 Tax=Cadophora gregata TaxID=51156 RepID=UPI0026DD4D2C|nr:uncharacterized protein ONS95_000250 [Cadophora gregata]KAK0099521.1 hypothetical protein ONS96_008358 [Cadophora gregata f. sp. sojae]KAK0128274.1 hypothetical protein ONS95_000250 [Cadophora gregata]